MIRMSKSELAQFMAERFPSAGKYADYIYELEAGRLSMRMPVAAALIRPGGTIAGPSLMTLADTAMYLLVLSMIGPVALAVTTNLNIDFLRRPAQTDVLAHAEMLKLGQRLAVARVTMYSDGEDDPIAHATVTYSIPPSNRR